MAFKMVLDSLDGLPEDVAKEYAERDGKFHIQVEGMKPPEEFTRLQTSLTAARTDAQNLKSKLSLLGDRKVEDVVAALDRIPELEAAAEGKLDEDKLNNLVEGRIKTRLAPLERERDTLKNERDELKGRVEQFEGKEKLRTIHDHVRAAAKESGVLETAIEDALLLADRVFELSDDGKVVVKDNSGFSAGLQPKDWFGDLQTKRPHWWGASQGGGAGGNRQGGGGAEANPWSHDGWNMTKQGEIFRKDSARAEQLAKAAGTTIGGGKPPKK